MRACIFRKRIGFAAGVTLLAGAIVGGAFVSPSAGGDERDARQAALWMLQPVGSWVWTTDLGAPGSVPVLISFHLDGTVSMGDGLMFGNPIAPPAGQGAKRGPGRGAWKYTGGQTFGGTSLWLRFNSSGFMEGWARSRSALEFVDPDHFQGAVYIESLGGCTTTPPIGCPDPTDPDAVWTPSPNMPPGGYAVSATRIRRIPMPE